MLSRECTWCKFVREFDGMDLVEVIKSHVESLPQEVKVNDKTYKARLAICDSCSSNADGLCRHCGCFVASRAAKKDLSCPHPDGEKWSIASGES